MDVTLRSLDDAELDRLFEWEQNPVAIEMAAFTTTDPSDRDAFDAHYKRIRNDPGVTLRAIDDGNGLVGTIASFWNDDHREVTYWIDAARWGHGVASAALRAFLKVETARPVYARVAAHNVGSATVLTRSGFEEIGSETAFAAGLGRDVLELIYRLDH